MLRFKCVHNTKLNKTFICCFLALIIVLQFTFPTNVAAEPTSPLLLYEEKLTEPVTEGVKYDRFKKFTADGWFTIHLLTVNNKENDLHIDTLIPEKGISSPEQLSSMVRKNGAVAGINGDFFNTGDNTFTIGPIVKSGELISNPDKSGNMGVISITKDGKSFLEKWSWQGIVNFPDGSNANIFSMNKSSLNPGNIMMYTREWSTTSPGKEKNKYDDYIEVVVENNKVMEIREKAQSVSIPENGFILTGRGAGYQRLKQKLQLGDYVEVEICSSPNWQELSAAIGGGAVLVRDGAVLPEFSHNIAGRHPRTAIGISEDQSTLYFVVVEGRNPLSRGMEQKDLADFLLSIGAYNALNLDGGGSSLMAVRPLGSENPIIANKLENNFERRIPNGLGIFNTGITGKLDGIKVKTSSERVPVGGEIALTVLGYDESYNPVQVNMDDIDWTVSDELGIFEGSSFIGTKSGRGFITANINGINHKTPIHVLSKPVELAITPTHMNLKPGGSKNLKIYIKDLEGYTAEISPDLLDWKIIGDIGQIDKGKFTANSSNTPLSGAIIAKYTDISTTVLTTVGSVENIIEDFREINNIETLSFPESVITNFEVVSTPELLFHSSVGKLKYDFTADVSTQASYLILGDGIKLPKGTSKLGLWVYGDKGNNHWLRALVSDASGNETNLTFVRNVDWNGWEKVECEIPAGLTHPIALKRIYLVETEEEKMDSGEIYFESLSAFSPPEYDYSLTSTDSKESIDPKNSYVELDDKISKDSFRFTVFGDALVGFNYDSSNYEQILKLYYASLDDNTDFLMFSGKFTDDSGIDPWQACNTWLSFSKKPIYPVINKSPYIIEQGNNLFTFLDISKGGLRLTKPEQWIYLQEQLENANGKNIFVTLNDNLSAFKDEYEMQLFEDMLTKHMETYDKEVWVFYGNVDEVEINRKNGVYYVGVPGVKTENQQYISFTVKDDVVTYQIRDFD